MKDFFKVVAVVAILQTAVVFVVVVWGVVMYL